jgi:ABC-type nitrate/sulfonate/bicarbonate transport system ATPase subunit
MKTHFRTKIQPNPWVDTKYLAQDFDLMPYTTVEENVGKFFIILPIKKLRIQELLEMVERRY